MATVDGNNVGYGSVGNYYDARIDYTVSYPSDTVGRVAWTLYVYVTGSISDSNNSAGSSGDLDNSSYGSQTYSFGGGGGTKIYASGTEDFDRGWGSWVHVEQEFWIQGLADGAGGGARSTAYLDIWLEPRSADVPSTPAAPTVTSIQQAQATINMTLPANNGATITDTGFWVYDASVGGSVVTSDPNVSTQTSWTPTGLTPGTNYWAEVAAGNSEGWSNRSPRTAFTTTTASTPDAPAAPSVGSITGTSAQISWSTPAANGSVISGYQIQVATDSGFGTIVIDTTDTASPLDVTTLVSQTMYWVRVRVSSNQGYSSWSTSTAFDTGATVPNAPTGLNTPLLGTDSATVAWLSGGANGSAETGYQLQVDTDNTFPTAHLGSLELGVGELGHESVHDSTEMTLSRALTGLTKGTLYYARARAGSALGYSAWSATLAFTTFDGLFFNVAGVWKPSELWFNPDGTWQKVELWFNPDGSWQQVA